MKPAAKVRALALVALATGGVTAWLFHSGRLGRRAPPSNTLSLYGNVDIRQVELGLRVAGRLKTMMFEEGQTVTAGTLLAALDARPFEDELRLVNPLRYFLVVTRGVFLKAMSFEEVVRSTVPLGLIALVTLSTATWLFRRRME